MDFRVYFENGKIGDLSSEQLNLHLNMQQAYKNLYEKRDSFAEKMKEKMDSSAIDISEECFDEYQKYCSSVQPELEVCMKYELTSLLPSLDVKIKKVKKL